MRRSSAITRSIEYRTCAHLLCLTIVIGREGALCEPCEDMVESGDTTTVGGLTYCPCCDNDSEDTI